MTGFGAAEGNAGGGRLRVEIRTVNHRYFNLSAKLPSDLAALEGELRERLRRDFERGHVGVSGALDRVRRRGRPRWRWTSSGRVSSSPGSASCSRRSAWSGEVTLELVARQPEVLVSTASEAPVEVPWAEVEPIVAQAAAECRAMRAREGAALADRASAPAGPARAGGRGRIARAGAGAAGPGARPAAGRRGASCSTAAPVDDDAAGPGDRVPGRQARHHRGAGALRGARRGRAARRWPATRRSGKQLGFLAQELGREVNTMGSKANDAEIAQQVIADEGRAGEVPGTAREPRVKPFLLVLSSPSGGGQDHHREAAAAGPRRSRATRSRPRRGPGATASGTGADYHFLTAAEFERRVEAGRVPGVGHVRRQPVRHAAERDRPDLRARAARGARHRDRGRAADPARTFRTSLQVFVLPPSAEVLVERLAGRNTETPAACASGSTARPTSWPRWRSTTTRSSTRIWSSRCAQVAAILDAESRRVARQARPAGFRRATAARVSPRRRSPRTDAAY